jgi:hypothetical protein
MKLTIKIQTDSIYKKKWQNESSGSKRVEIEWKGMIVLVEIAFEAAIPFGVWSGNGESGEEFGERTRWRWPVDLTEGVDEILCCYVAPIHWNPRIRNP